MIKKLKATPDREYYKFFNTDIETFYVFPKTIDKTTVDGFESYLTDRNLIKRIKSI